MDKMVGSVPEKFSDKLLSHISLCILLYCPGTAGSGSPACSFSSHEIPKRIRLYVLRVYAALATAMLIFKYWSRWTYAASARAHLVLNSWRSPCCSSKGCVSARYSIIDFNGTWAVSSRAQLVLNIDHDGTYAASARARLVLNSWQSPRCSSRGCVNVRYATTNLIIWTEPTLFQQGLS